MSSEIPGCRLTQKILIGLLEIIRGRMQAINCSLAIPLYIKKYPAEPEEPTEEPTEPVEQEENAKRLR